MSPPPLHELERAVMEVVWREGQTSVRDVYAALNAGDERQRAYTTVMTVMHRLADKGVLTRERAGRGDLFAAAIERAAYAQAQVESMIAEYGDVALVSFAREMRKLDASRRAKLQRLARDED